ncbi:MAG TPA: arylsulfatase [bacterium]|jgi:arylsulfatase A-like enzyme|nr:arylsulfatase [bacterium]HQV36585.1 arylsulfatase [Flavobacterium sp.]
MFLNYSKRGIFLVATVLFFVSSCKETKEGKEKQQQQAAQPNILIIVADDMGFSDIGCLGGEIQTPVIDKIAQEGQLFSNFYVQPTCSPTRSSLLTGCDNHFAGVGIMHEMDYPALHELNLPEYAGSLKKDIVTLPEILRENGYHTYMVGKWHLGEDEGQNPFDRGFEETFILGSGGGSHSNDGRSLAPPQTMTYTRNGIEVKLPEDFYSTKNYTDSIIKFIDRNKKDNKPFFAYQSYTAVHDPLQAPKEYIDKYKGKFDAGWDALSEMRFANLKKLGIIPADLKSTFKNPGIPKWEKLTHEQKEEFARDMEVYAAMLDYMDKSIGRIIDYLKKEGKYDNTMIVFMSDNGANGAVAAAYPGNADGKYLSTFNNSMQNKGLKGSFVEMGPGWAKASSSPFRFFKGFTAEGGIKAPLIVKMPNNAGKKAGWNNTFLHVTDILPTVLEVTQTKLPTELKGKKVENKFIGKSMVSVIDGTTTVLHEEGMGWELFEMRAFRKGKYKILRLPVPFGTGDWELFDIEKDPIESNDLSKTFPEIKAELIKSWEAYAQYNKVHDHKGFYDNFYRNNLGPGNGKERN